MKNKENLKVFLDKNRKIIEISNFGKKLEIPIKYFLGTKSCIEQCPISDACKDQYEICHIIGDKTGVWAWYIDVPKEDGLLLRHYAAIILGLKGKILKKKVNKNFKRRQDKV